MLSGTAPKMVKINVFKKTRFKSISKTLANLNYLGNKLMSSWTEDRVRIIKLEDFRSNQADYIDSINNFFGITEEPEVKKWFAKVGF